MARYTTSSGQEAMTHQEWRDRGGYQATESSEYCPQQRKDKIKALMSAGIDKSTAEEMVRQAQIGLISDGEIAQAIAQAGRGQADYETAPTMKGSMFRDNLGSRRPSFVQPAELPAGEYQTEPAGGLLTTILSWFVKTSR